MRKRGYTWLLSDPGHLPVSIGTLNPPFYWVGPGGYRFQATGHNGRGKLTGPAGAVVIFDLLARWNDTGYLALFPEEFREEIARDVGYQMSRRPFGGTITSMAH